MIFIKLILDAPTNAFLECGEEIQNFLKNRWLYDTI